MKPEVKRSVTASINLLFVSLIECLALERILIMKRSDQRMRKAYIIVPSCTRELHQVQEVKQRTIKRYNADLHRLKIARASFINIPRLVRKTA